MKIEMTGLTAIQAPAERSAKPVSTTNPPLTPAVPADHVSFHSDNSSVPSLVSQAMATPTVRQDKVDALRQSIGNGTYKVDAGKIASALIAGNGQ